MKKIIITFFSFLLIVSLLIITTQPKRRGVTDTYIENPTNELSTNVSEEADPIAVTLDVLEALNYYNFATTIEPSSDDTTAIMTSLMDSKNRMAKGDVFVRGYTEDPNEYTNLTAKGIVMGSQIV